MPKILAVEDDPKIIEAIAKTLTLAPHFTLQSVSDTQKVLSTVLSYRPDLILLDIRLPGGDGRLILKSLKENVATRSIPVIFLTGMGSEGDKVLGLELGADDYIAKPFGAMELLARIQAVYRRVRPQGALAGTFAGSAAGDIVRAEGLELDRGNAMATLGGKRLRLQPKEFEILFLLASNPGRALTRTYLTENSSSYGMPVSSRSLDTHIKNIRKKLGSKAWMIETVPKRGYRFAA